MHSSQIPAGSLLAAVGQAALAQAHSGFRCMRRCADLAGSVCSLSSHLARISETFATRFGLAYFKFPTDTLACFAYFYGIGLLRPLC